MTTWVSLEDIMLNTSEKDKYQGSPSVKPKQQNETKTDSNTENGCQEGKGWVKIGEEDYEERTSSYAIHKPWECNNTVITIWG